MLPFMTNVYTFKGTTKRLHHTIKTYSSVDDFTPLTLYTYFWVNESLKEKHASLLESLCSKLYIALQDHEIWPLSLNQLQNMVTKSAINDNYHAFRKQVLEDDYNARRFWGIRDDAYQAYTPIQKMTHQYPSAIHSEIPELKHWKTVWELNPCSYMNAPFIAPVIPKEVFGKENITVLKYQTWDNGTAPEASGHQYCGVLYKNGSEIVGVMSWYWWGSASTIKGLEVRVALKLKETLNPIGLCMDIRAEYPDPTFGPSININYQHFDSLVRDVQRYNAREVLEE